MQAREDFLRIALPEERAGVAPSRAHDQSLDIAIEPYRDATVQDQRAGFGIDESATAGRNHAVPFVDQPGDYTAFAIAKIRLAELVENLADAALRRGFDSGVAIDEIGAHQIRQPLANGGFARAHQPDQNDRPIDAARQRRDLVGRHFGRVGHCGMRYRWAIGGASGEARDRGAVFARLGRRNTALLIVLVVLLLIIAWYQGGEEPVRAIQEDVPVPKGAL